MSYEAILSILQKTSPEATFSEPVLNEMNNYVGEMGRYLYSIRYVLVKRFFSPLVLVICIYQTTHNLD